MTFSAGDSVECVESKGAGCITVGKVYSVVSVDEDGDPVIVNDKGDKAAYVSWRFGRPAKNAEKGNQMEISIETITPAQAERYLLFNTSNRTLRKTLVSQYARDMANGKWKLTHQGVAFNCDGTLLDGQHRLKAIVESGVTVQMLVARGVDSQNQLVMDDHAKRSAGDALTLSRGERVSTTDVAIIRAAVELQEGYGYHNTKAELNELINLFRGALDFTSEFLATKYRGVTSAPVWASIALAWFYVDDLDRLRAFCRMLCGVEMVTQEGDRAALMLREWLLRTGVKYSTQRREAFRKTQRAIVAFMKHQKIDKLYGTTVHYPWPLVNPVRMWPEQNGKYNY